MKKEVCGWFKKTKKQRWELKQSILKDLLPVGCSKWGAIAFFKVYRRCLQILIVLKLKQWLPFFSKWFQVA